MRNYTIGLVVLLHLILFSHLSTALAQEITNEPSVTNNPYKYTDPTGNFVDNALDIGFIAYDIKQIHSDPSITNYVSLGADVLGAAIPGATGLGAGVRVSAKGIKNTEKVLNGLKGAEKAGDIAKTVPNPSGSKGGPAHQAEVDAVENELVSRGLEPIREASIKNPITSETRRADIIGINSETRDVMEVHQIGRANPVRGDPVARERNALSDIEGSIQSGAVASRSGQKFNFNKYFRTYFHRYNRKAK